MLKYNWGKELCMSQAGFALMSVYSQQGSDVAACLCVCRDNNLLSVCLNTHTVELPQLLLPLQLRPLLSGQYQITHFSPNTDKQQTCFSSSIDVHWQWFHLSVSGDLKGCQCKNKFTGSANEKCEQIAEFLLIISAVWQVEHLLLMELVWQYNGKESLHIKTGEGQENRETHLNSACCGLVTQVPLSYKCH